MREFEGLVSKIIFSEVCISDESLDEFNFASFKI